MYIYIYTYIKDTSKNYKTFKHNLETSRLITKVITVLFNLSIFAAFYIALYILFPICITKLSKL